MKTMSLTLEKNIELKIIFTVLQGNQLELESLITNPSINWKILYKLILLHRVWHQVYVALTSLHNHPCSTTTKAQYPIPIYSQLELLCKKDKMRILTTAAETLRIAREFTKHNLQHCFLKGVTLNESLYGGLITRPCKDIDVWVDVTSYRHAMEILFALGYKKKTPSYELNNFKERYYMQHKRDIALYHAEHAMEVELHFRLSYFGICYNPSSNKISQCSSILNTPIQTFAHNHHLLYLMIHGASHAFIRMRWLNDIALYIKSEKCSLSSVVLLSNEINCKHIVIQTLILVRNLLKLETTEMKSILKSTNKKNIKLAVICEKFIIDGYDLSGGLGIYTKHFFIYRWYLTQIAPKGHKLSAIIGDLFKIDKIFSYFTFSDKFKFMYYIVYPVWVIKYIIFRR